MTDQETPEILKDLLDGHSVFCKTCKHRIAQHFPYHYAEELVEIGLDYGHCFYKTAGISEDCKCRVHR